MDRVIAYIDGYNLYYGLRAKGWKRFYWLNLVSLVRNLLKPGQTLVKVKYFTTLVSNPMDKRKRQSTFIEALETLGDLEIFYGKFLVHEKNCVNCGHKTRLPSEKMTDVNIASEILCDGFKDLYDTVMLISADSDLSSPVLKVQKEFSNKRVVAVFPPERHSLRLQQIANSSFTIGRANLAKSLFPDQVTKPDGFVLRRPIEWR